MQQHVRAMQRYCVLCSLLLLQALLLKQNCLTAMHNQGDALLFPRLPLDN